MMQRMHNHMSARLGQAAREAESNMLHAMLMDAGATFSILNRQHGDHTRYALYIAGLFATGCYAVQMLIICPVPDVRQWCALVRLFVDLLEDALAMRHDAQITRKYMKGKYGRMQRIMDQARPHGACTVACKNRGIPRSPSETSTHLQGIFSPLWAKHVLDWDPQNLQEEKELADRYETSFHDAIPLFSEEARRALALRGDGTPPAPFTDAIRHLLAFTLVIGQDPRVTLARSKAFKTAVEGGVDARSGVAAVSNAPTTAAAAEGDVGARPGVAAVSNAPTTAAGHISGGLQVGVGARTMRPISRRDWLVHAPCTP